MGNSIEKAKLYLSTLLDEKMLQELTTAWMEGNAGNVKYSGGNEIKIPKISFNGGMGDYTRDTGFAAGDVTLAYETHVFDKDRSKTFNLDAMDVDESGFAATASNVMSEFQSQYVVPEVDAYRYSRLFSFANTALKTANYLPATATIFGQLKSDIAAVQDIVGEQTQLVIAMNFSTASILEQADKIEKSLDVSTFTAGGINSTVKSIDGIPIIKVSSARFKSAYTFSETVGFTPTATAMDLNWIIIARRSPVAIVKTDKVRVFEPDTNQSMDGWKIDMRKYHTLILPDNKIDSLFVSYKSTAAPALTATVAAGTGTGNTKFTATAATGNTLGYTINTTAADTGYFNTIPTITAYTSAASIAGTAGKYLNMYEVDAAGRVQKFLSHLLVAGDIA